MNQAYSKPPKEAQPTVIAVEPRNISFDTLEYFKRLDLLIKQNNFCFTDTVGVYNLVVEDSLTNQHPASFPGGYSALQKFLARNIIYPSVSVENGIQGKVFVKFIVNKNGQICNLTFLKLGGYGLPEAVLKTLRMMPQWNPAVVQGKPVNSYYILPVNFNQIIYKN